MKELVKMFVAVVTTYIIGLLIVCAIAYAMDNLSTSQEYGDPMTGTEFTVYKAR